MACIEMSGLADGALTNVDRIMTATPDGEAVGLHLTSTGAVDNWMRAVDSLRCRCFMNQPGAWVPSS